MFLTIGIIGVVLLLFALVFDDILDGALDGIIPDTEWLSLASIAAFMAAFGAGGFILQEQAGLAVLPAIGGGSVLAVISAYAAVRFGHAAMHIPTDATPQVRDLVGSRGKVVTGIAAGSTGEALVYLGGQPVKVTASAVDGSAVPRGTNVIVVSAESSTRVIITTAPELWSTQP